LIIQENHEGQGPYSKKCDYPRKSPRPRQWKVAAVFQKELLSKKITEAEATKGCDHIPKKCHSPRKSKGPRATEGCSQIPKSIA
jgi:hypothetical protein